VTSVEYYKSYFNVLPSWDDIITALDYDITHRPASVKLLKDLGFVTHFGNEVSKVEKIRQQIHAMRPEETICTAHLYISLLTISETFGWHKDDTDVFFVQALGQTKWQIEGDLEYILSPGDMLFVSKNLMHNTIPLSPRVGISIGFTE
jgi:ribosomal protein L16 Arg81 hydroxylase